MLHFSPLSHKLIVNNLIDPGINVFVFFVPNCQRNLLRFNISSIILQVGIVISDKRKN